MVAEWLTRSMVGLGPLQTKVKIAQLVADAELKTLQERLAREAGLRKQFEQE